MKTLFHLKVGMFFAAALLTLISMAAVALTQDLGGHWESWTAELISFKQVPEVLARSGGKLEPEVNDDQTISLSHSDMSSPMLQGQTDFGATNGGATLIVCGGDLRL